MNKSKMIAAIVERHKVRLDEDDPAFILVELNRMALEEVAENLAGRLEQAHASIDDAVSKMNLQTSQLIAATEKHVATVNKLREESTRVTLLAINEGKNAQLKDLQETMTVAASRAIANGAGGAEVKAALADIHKAAENLERSSRNAGERKSGSLWSGLALAVLGGLIAGGVMLGGMYYLSKQEAPITEHQARWQNLGSAIENNWMKFNEATRRNITNIVRGQ